jgi:hypothetical protein
MAGSSPAPNAPGKAFDYWCGPLASVVGSGEGREARGQGRVGATAVSCLLPESRAAVRGGALPPGLPIAIIVQLAAAPN